MGKLIVFEGVDGSGKSTQYKLLCDRLKRQGIPYRSLVFPRYSEPSSALIRMYLAGEFGDKPGDVNAYAASAFFAVDRYASYVQDWREFYLNGGLVVTDRYTTSNAVHQASILADYSGDNVVGYLHIAQLVIADCNRNHFVHFSRILDFFISCHNIVSSFQWG